jgi:hypothetical protein
MLAQQKGGLLLCFQKSNVGLGESACIKAMLSNPVVGGQCVLFFALSCLVLNFFFVHASIYGSQRNCMKKFSSFDGHRVAPNVLMRKHKYVMRLHEFATQPNTAEQLKIDVLKTAKDKANANLAAERKRQQVAKAQKKLLTVQRIPVPSINVQ